MKLFGQYSEAIRSKVIDMLADRGIHVWDAGFNQNSESVLLECALAEKGASGLKAPEKPLYTWTPEMRAEYRNSPDGLRGERMSDDVDYSEAVMS